MQYYLDTSSFVKIYHREEGSNEVLKVYESDGKIYISELVIVEFVSTVHRKYREGQIDALTLEALIDKLNEDIDQRYDILPFSQIVIEEAERLIQTYGKKNSIRALDSLQFAFFLAYCDNQDVFVCSDKRLASIVTLEGFRVSVPKEQMPEVTDAEGPTKSDSRIFLSPPHLGTEELNFVQQAFESNYIAPLGPMVDAFEREFAEYTGIPHALALSSGTAAIHLALDLLGVGPGDEVFASTLTFIGSVSPVTFLGGTPVFIDADPDTWNLSPDLLAQALETAQKRGRLPKAVLPTDLYGQCADYDRLQQICDQYGVPLVIDAAEALGAAYKDRSAGDAGTAAIYSFNGNKIITTSGGGMLVSRDRELIEKARNLSQQAREPFPHYEHVRIGYNYRMSNILAAIGRGQLSVLDERVRRKREIFDFYFEALKNVAGISFMPMPDWSRANRWLTVILITPEEFGADREAVRVALEKENIESRPVWKPMHLQPVFDVDCGMEKNNYPQVTQIDADDKGRRRYPCRVVGGGVSEDLFERGLCLPSGTAMGNGDLDRVIDVVLKAGAKIIGDGIKGVVNKR